MRSMCFKTKEGNFLLILLGGSRLSEAGSIKTCHNISIVKVEDDGFSCFINKPLYVNSREKENRQVFRIDVSCGQSMAPNPLIKLLRKKYIVRFYLQKLTGVSLVDYSITP